MGKQNINGKAFEYACMLALYDALHGNETVHILESKSTMQAESNYNSLHFFVQNEFERAAQAATRVLLRLEPQLEFPQNDNPLYLSIQGDAKGQVGDVRDVLCIRRTNNWEIGISCKHNHHAVKHSRLSSSIDFGTSWFGTPCSSQYFLEITPLFQRLRQMRELGRQNNEKALWSNIPDKEDKYYLPVLQAFMDELKRLYKSNSSVPGALIQYLIGRNDFYKVIADEKNCVTRVEAVNISGTLNRSSGTKRSIVTVPLLKLPSRIYHIDFAPESKNTIQIVLDEGWAVSMRIHNASSEVEPSLKFDVNLISLPGSIHAQVEPW